MPPKKPRWTDYVALDDLTPATRNAKLHTIPGIGASLERFGIIDQITLDERTGQIISGHGRLESFTVARDRGDTPPEGVVVTKGVWTVPVNRGWSSVDDTEAEAAGIAVNELTTAGGWDPNLLAEMLSSVRAADADLLPITGFDSDRLNTLLDSLKQAEPDPTFDHDPNDDDPTPKAKAVSKPGDLWECGPHRVLCGDSTLPESIVTVLGGGLADMVWTDPPYGVDYVGKTKDALTITNDRIDDQALELLLRSAFTAVLGGTRPGAVWHVSAPPGPPSLAFSKVLQECGVWRQCYVWIKDVFVLGYSDLHYRHELVFYGWTPGAAHHAPAERTWDTVWEIPRPKRSTEHPTMKPVELVERALRLNSNKGQVVLDPFGGSGTTLLAAHRSGRLARLVEKDPVYVDVICRRYQTLTGDRPTRNGKPHSFT